MKKLTVILAFLGMLFSAAGGSAYYFFDHSEVLKSISILINPKLTGPEVLCFGFGGKSILGSFSGGGIPETDVYTWKIFGPSGDQISQTISGGELLQSINYTFSSPGVHRVELQVKRGVIVFPVQTLNVRVQERPQPILNPSYSLCGSDPLDLQAISPSSPFFSDYRFEWTNSTGTIVSTANGLTVTQPGSYSVKVFIPNSAGEPECTSVFATQVRDSNNTTVESTADSFCSNQNVTLSTNPSSQGKWFLKKSGSSTETLINSNANTVNLTAQDMTEGFGSYDVIFEVINPDAVNCLIRKTKTITYNSQPDFVLLDPVPSSGCAKPDGGIVVQALTDIDYLYIENTNTKTPSLKAGEIYTIPGIESGAYNLISVLGNCINSYASVVPLGNPPDELDFEINDIQGETCTIDGRLNGNFLVNLLNGPTDGFYTILDEKGGLFAQESFTNKTDLFVSLPGGNYVFELSNQDSCSFAKEEFIEIPGKLLVDYFVPEELFICQTGELTPTSSNPNLEYELISPTGIVQLKSSNEPFLLSESGEHKIIGRDPLDSLFCPVSKLLNVTLVDPVDFEVVLIEEDCLGNRTFQADLKGRDPSTVFFTWYNGKDEIVGNGEFLNPVSTGEFKLDVQPANSSACPIPPKPFQVKEPILTMEVELTATQLCELGPKAIITADLEYPGEVTDLIWRRFNPNGDIVELPEFKNLTEVEINESGTYEVAVFSIIPEISKSCELGRKSIQIELNTDRVSFEVPQEITFCEETTITPQTTQVLAFEVTGPDGEIQLFNSGENFALTLSGVYEVYAYDPSPNPTLCPEQKTINSIRKEKITFTPVFLNQDCNGNSTYTADLGGVSAAEAEIRWINSNGTTVGTDQTFTTKIPGNYKLDVQPANSLSCSQEPISFEVIAPVLNLELELVAETLCPDASSAALKVNTNFEEVDKIVWTFFSLFGEPTTLNSFANSPEILASKEGTYKVQLFNKFGCIIGTDQKLILRSQDEKRPLVEENYVICPKYDIGPTINPGSFAGYEWYFRDQLVSTSPTYKPDRIGNYTLIVFSNEGCAYQTTFETEEECELKISYPNAIQPGNPDKGFLIYSNYLVEELEVWIFNKWGNVVFHCKDSNPIQGESTCIWDGIYNNKNLLPGTYAIRINYVNIEKNIKEEQLGAIMIIE
jgi:hypothetical protein